MKKNIFKGLLTVLFAFALVFAIGTVSAHAEDPEPSPSPAPAPAPTGAYDAERDAIVFTTNVTATTKLYYASVKDDKETELKGSKFKSLTAAKVGDTDAYEVVIALNDKEKGVKIAPEKDTYLVVVFEEPAADSTKYTANYIVKGSESKKLAITFNYLKADASLTTDSGIASVSVTLNQKEKAVKVYPSTTADATLALTDIVGRLEYAVVPTDKNAAREWKPVYASDAYKFTGATLYDLVKFEDKKKAPKLEFRLLGTAQSGSGETIKYATRTSKVAKATVKLEAKAAKSIKLDAVKCTLAVKNGYDYAVLAASGEAVPVPVMANWSTVIPYKREGVATGAIVATATFTPAKKLTDATKASFTAQKVAGIDALGLWTGATKDAAEIYVFSRKSATVDKPAQKPAYIKLAKQTAAPVIAATAEVYATTDSKNVKVPEITNAATDANKFDYYYTVVKASDFDATTGENALAEGVKIDWSTVKWTKTAKDKNLSVTSLKTNYKLAGENAKISEKVFTDADETYYILVRRAGNAKLDDAKGLVPCLPSAYLKTKLVQVPSTAEGAAADTKDTLWVSMAWTAPAAPTPSPEPSPEPEPEG